MIPVGGSLREDCQVRFEAELEVRSSHERPLNNPCRAGLCVMAGRLWLRGEDRFQLVEPVEMMRTSYTC